MHRSPPWWPHCTRRARPNPTAAAHLLVQSSHREGEEACGRQDAQQVVVQRTPLQQTANKSHGQTGEDVAERDKRGGPGADLGAEGAATLRQLEEFVDSLHV